MRKKSELLAHIQNTNTQYNLPVFDKKISYLLLRESEQAKKLQQRLIKKHNEGKALGILSNKLGRAVYYMLKNKKAFDMNKFFGN